MNLKIIGIVLAIIAVFFIGHKLGSYLNDNKLETYNRQLQGQLTEKEKQLQEQNKSLGIARSQLVTQKELADQLQQSNEELDYKFQSFIKKYNLEIASRDLTIDQLKQKITDGNSTVTVGKSCTDLSKDCIISYSWEDTLGRFKLQDPNIFTKHDEVFYANQLFRVYGETYRQKNGSLQTRRIVLREVYLKDGKYVEIPDAKVEVVDSNFTYTNPPILEIEPKLFNLRLIAVAGVNIIKDAGVTKFGTGVEFMSYKDVGLNSHLAFDFRDLKRSEIRLGAEYNLKLFDTQTNIGLGIALGTPLEKLFNDYTLSLNSIFYITN